MTDKDKNKLSSMSPRELVKERKRVKTWLKKLDHEIQYRKDWYGPNFPE